MKKPEKQTLEYYDFYEVLDWVNEQRPGAHERLWYYWCGDFSNYTYQILYLDVDAVGEGELQQDVQMLIDEFGDEITAWVSW